jgi:hypothetical protein
LPREGVVLGLVKLTVCGVDKKMSRLSGLSLPVAAVVARFMQVAVVLVVYVQVLRLLVAVRQRKRI